MREERSVCTVGEPRVLDIVEQYPVRIELNDEAIQKVADNEHDIPLMAVPLDPSVRVHTSKTPEELRMM